MDTENNVADTSAPADDLRASLAAAFDTPAEPKQPSTDPVADPTAPKATARDETGKFAKAEAIEPAPSAVEPTETAPSATTDAVRPPPGWSIAAKAAFDSLPHEVKEAIAQREEQVSRGFKQYEGLGAYNDMAQKAGMSLPELVGAYVNVEKVLTERPVDALQWLCNRYGVHPEQLLGGTAQQPVSMPPQPDVAATVADILAQREMQSEIQQFFANPANKFADNLRDDMALLLQNGKAKTLQDAYEQACWLNSDTRAMRLKEQSAPQINTLAATATQARQAAKSVTGAPGGTSTPTGKPKAGSLREQLAEGFDALV